MTGTFVLVGGLAVIASYSLISKGQIIVVLCTVVICLATLISVGYFMIELRTKKRRLEKLRALRFVDTHLMDGLVFEKYVAELLKSQGYTNVTLTERFDYGVDIIATKDQVRWGVQVKRYSRMVKAEAVRQVVTALNQYKCQRAMVVTNSTFSRPATVLAQSNNCVLIGKDELADWIVAFQAGSTPVSN